jgi:hypothetical protein
VQERLYDEILKAYVEKTSWVGNKTKTDRQSNIFVYKKHIGLGLPKHNLLAASRLTRSKYLEIGIKNSEQDKLKFADN